MVLAVLAQMLGELVDARSEQRDLDLGGPGVRSPRPYLATISRFFSAASVMRTRNRSRESAAFRVYAFVSGRGSGAFVIAFPLT